MSETSGLTHCQVEGGSGGGIGSPLPNTMAKLVDWETGETVGPGSRGELCVSGPQVMLGYHRNSRATKRQLQDHWLHTGDVYSPLHIIKALLGDFKELGPTSHLYRSPRIEHRDHCSKNRS